MANIRASNRCMDFHQTKDQNYQITITLPLVTLFFHGVDYVVAYVFIKCLISQRLSVRDIHNNFTAHRSKAYASVPFLCNINIATLFH
jgi:hypothetical protein